MEAKKPHTRVVKALVVTGYGINCEREIEQGCKLAGAEVLKIHAHDFLKQAVCLDNVQLLLLPGGFSFGDELGAGKAFANRLAYASGMKEKLQDFVKKGNCILGICNGFQLLVKLGLLPGSGTQEISLSCNDSLKFENRWVRHKVTPSVCVFTQGLEELYLPVRHGEGKVVFRDPSVLQRLLDGRQVVFRYADPLGNATQQYPHNPNGSTEAIAGICDPTGRILGMMAHPEAALRFINHPQWTRLKNLAARKNAEISWRGEGSRIFENVVNYLGREHETANFANAPGAD